MSRKKKTRPTTVACKQTGVPHDLSLGRVALLLAIARKRKAMKKKSRNLTDRALRQWIASRKPEGMIAQISALVLDAARRSRRISPDKTQMPVLVHEILLRGLVLEMTPKRGRKPKLGIIGRAMRDANKQPRATTRLFKSPTDERKWLERIYGVKAGLLANRDWSRGATLDDIVEHYGNKLLPELDREISDGKAAAKKSVRSIAPGSSIEAIKARIRRARDKPHKLDIPTKKSGG
jgi:hypothetical protein